MKVLLSSNAINELNSNILVLSVLSRNTTFLYCSEYEMSTLSLISNTTKLPLVVFSFITNDTCSPSSFKSIIQSKLSDILLKVILLFVLSNVPSIPDLISAGHIKISCIPSEI